MTIHRVLKKKSVDKDAELIRLCAKGDKNAQKTLFETFKRDVMVICKRYARDTEDANDSFQEAFIRILEGLRKAKKIDSLRHWVVRVTINTCINIYNKERIRDHETFIPEVMSDGQFRHILENIAIQELTEVVNKLPDGYRLVFNLFIIDGYSHKEIAEQLGINESTSRSQLTKAKKYLKIELGKLGIQQYEKAV